MFLHMSVILFTGGYMPRGGVMYTWGHACLGVCMHGGMHAKGSWVCVPRGKACMPRSMHAWGHAYLGCACPKGSIYAQGACMPGRWHASWGVGVHGMHATMRPDVTRCGQSMSRRYTSYWNAFLLKIQFL